MATEEHAKKDDALAIELPAPAGWVKKIIPKKAGTPRRSDIVFISPTGEEIKDKRHLEQYLIAHPEGPAASEFEWAATGNTPRRSARLSEKSKAVELSASQPPMKKQKRSSTKRGGAKEKNNADAEEAAAAAEETDESAKVLDADMNDVGEGASLQNPSAEDINNKAETEMQPENPNAEDAKKKTETETHPENPNAKDADKKTEEMDTILEAPSAPEPPIDVNSNVAPTGPAADSKIEESGTSEVPDTKNGESKDAHPATEDSNMDESKDAYDPAKGTPTVTVDNAQPPAATALNSDILKEKQAAAETSNNNNAGVTGS